jgi:DUF917 family protein
MTRRRKIMRVLTMDDVIAAVKGGSVFASGGGGWVDHGLEIGGAAVTIGQPKLVSVDELPDDAIIVTATAIGVPAEYADRDKELEQEIMQTLNRIRELDERYGSPVSTDGVKQLFYTRKIL